MISSRLDCRVYPTFSSGAQLYDELKLSRSEASPYAVALRAYKHRAII
jgi:hypothetical protein